MGTPPTTSEAEWKRKVLTSAGPYPLAAYEFVHEGLGYAVRRFHGESGGGGNRHVSGQQLCLGLREFAIQQFGLMAPAVLSHWNIRRTDDFGRMVFAMIAAEVMSRTDEDTLEDFRGVYDFDEAFNQSAVAACLGGVR